MIINKKTITLPLCLASLASFSLSAEPEIEDISELDQGMRNGCVQIIQKGNKATLNNNCIDNIDFYVSAVLPSSHYTKTKTLGSMSSTDIAAEEGAKLNITYASAQVVALVGNNEGLFYPISTNSTFDQPVQALSISFYEDYENWNANLFKTKTYSDYLATVSSSKPTSDIIFNSIVLIPTYGKAVLYSEYKHKGSSFIFSGEKLNNLRESGISSLFVNAGYSVNLYSENDFSGEIITLHGPKLFSFNEYFKEWDNKAASAELMKADMLENDSVVELRRENIGEIIDLRFKTVFHMPDTTGEKVRDTNVYRIQSGYVLTVYEKPNYQGRSIKIAGPMQGTFHRYGWETNAPIGSLKIDYVGDYELTTPLEIYTNSLRQGGMFAPTYEEVGESLTVNDLSEYFGLRRFQSVLVRDNWKLTLYERINLSGKSTVITGHQIWKADKEYRSLKLEKIAAHDTKQKKDSWFSHFQGYEPDDSLATLDKNGIAKQICRFKTEINNQMKTVFGYVDQLSLDTYLCTGGSEITIRDANGIRRLESEPNSFEWLSMNTAQNAEQKIKAFKDGDEALCSLVNAENLYGAGWINKSGQCVSYPEIYWSNNKRWLVSYNHRQYQYWK